ncbi:class I glutamine amidotransferase-like protein [Mycena rebaudengoi]|nr:class I glutamine amidotransferase-like protein [Mycena rebaudengoi]
MSNASPQHLSIAVCISDGVTLSDFITPIEILSGLNYNPVAPIFGVADLPTHSPYTVTIDYLSDTMKPVVSLMGATAPTLNPSMTYDDAMNSGKQFDVLWVPAGPFPESRLPKLEIAFIAQQAPKAKYVLSVCAGAVQLALAGVLTGKRATTNKAFYRTIVEMTPKDINWVPRARWVVDGNVWTSSGVAAATWRWAFIEHLAGPKLARYIRGGIEIPEVTEDDDPFAAFHGLV